METLVLDSRGAALGFCGVSHNTLVVQLPRFGPQRLLSGLLVAVIKLPVLCSGYPTLVLLGQDFSVLNRLDGAVVMVLVDLLIGGSLDLFMPGRFDRLVLDGRGGLLMDGSIVMTRLSVHVVNGYFSPVKDADG